MIDRQSLAHATARHRALVYGLVAALLLLIALPASVHAGTSPLGDTAAAWPSSWSPYLAADGTPYRDEDGDQSPGYADLSSGAASGLGSLPSLYLASNGSNIFFRMRIHDDPADASHGGFHSMVYQIGVYIGGIRQAVIGLNGKPSAVDQVYVANDSGSTVLSIYEYPFTSPSAGARALSDGSGFYFVDFQVPIARVTQVDADVTASALTQLTISTATANNLVDPNKDDPPTDSGSTVSLGTATLDLTKSKAHVSGPNPPEVGVASVYDLTLTAASTGGNAITGLVVTDAIPSGLSIVSTSTATGSISSSGQNVTWTVGTLNPGGSATATVRVSVTPANAAYGGPVLLNPGASGSGTDAATGAAVTDTSGSSSTGNVGGNRTPTANDDTAATTAGGSTVINVLANDSDPDGALPASGVSVSASPAQGSATVNPDGTITYAANISATGTDTFTYQACDGGSPNWCDTATVSVSIVNAPVANDDTDVVNEDGTKTTNVVANDTDPDGDLDPSSVIVTASPIHGSVVNHGAGTITYTPNPDFHGTDSYTYRVCDATAVCDTAVVSFTITSVADAPVAADDSDTVAEDGSVTTDVAANDTDADGDLDTSSVSVTGAPAHGSAVANGDGTVTYTPDPDYHGGDAYTYRICDATAVCDTATVTLTVSSVGDAPVAVADSDTVAEDGAVTTDVAANDSDVDGDLDPTSVSIIGPAAHGAAVANGDGTVTYTPDPDYSGPDSYSYQICDGAANCDSATVSLTITAVDDAPVANADSDTVAEDGSATIDVAANDTDADGDLDPTSVSITAPPSHGAAVANGDGTVTYTPDPDYNGPDSYTYQICDAALHCSSATVTLTISAGADAPNAVSDSDTVAEDGSVTTDVSANDTDIDGDLDPTSVAITGLPSHGTATPNGDGTVTYVPDPDWFGGDGYTYEICDLTFLCDTATVAITVAAVDDDPVANDDSDTVAEDGSVTTDVAANDSDVDGDLDPASVAITAPPSHGTATPNNDGTVTYTPDPGYGGPDAYTYQICDGAANCDTATVTLAVAAVGDFPVANDDADSVAEDGSVTTDVAANDSDIDGDLDPSSVTVSIPPTHGSAVANGDGTVTYTPDADYAGADAYTYQICDLALNCSTAVVDLTVNGTDDAPVAADDSATVAEDGAVTTDVSANDSDVDADLDPTSVSITAVPSHGAAVANGDGTVTYTPDPDYAGADAYSYQVCDLAANCDTATVDVTVTAADDPPTAADDSATIDEDGSVTSDVLANDTDADGPFDPDDMTVDTAPSHGTAVVNADGTVTYTPDPDWNGTDAYTYQVCDSTPTCVTATVTITVDPVEDAPVANDDFAPDIAAPSGPMVIPVLGNDVDADDDIDPSSVIVTVDPLHGTYVVDPSTGDVTYTPDPGYSGTDVLTYRVCDLGTPSLCDTADVTITVAGTAPKPTTDPADMPQSDTDDSSDPAQGSPSSLLLLALVTATIFILAVAYDSRRRNDQPW